MFFIQVSSPCDFAGTINAEEMPAMLGPWVDANGHHWDVRGIFQLAEGNWVQACPQGSMHPYYTDTSGRQFGTVHQTWKPYRVKLAGGEKDE